VRKPRRGVRGWRRGGEGASEDGSLESEKHERSRTMNHLHAITGSDQRRRLERARRRSARAARAGRSRRASWSLIRGPTVGSTRADQTRPRRTIAGTPAGRGYAGPPAAGLPVGSWRRLRLSRRAARCRPGGRNIDLGPIWWGLSPRTRSPRRERSRFQAWHGAITGIDDASPNDAIASARRRTGTRGRSRARSSGCSAPGSPARTGLAMDASRTARWRPRRKADYPLLA